MSFENEYRELMEKPIEEIREDIFFRPDNFQHELWYGDFQMYMTVGICQPPEEHALQVRKALKVMGYGTPMRCLGQLPTVWFQVWERKCSAPTPL